MAKRVAVLLSGYGENDGPEYTESIGVLLALDELGAKATAFAPASAMEAARRMSHAVADTKDLKVDDFDALVMPGGPGVQQVLWKNPDTSRALRDFFAQEKPIGTLGMAGGLAALILGHKGISLTVGAEERLVQAVKATGAQHEECAGNDFISDRAHRIVSTPAKDFRGIQLAMRELVEMA